MKFFYIFFSNAYGSKLQMPLKAFSVQFSILEKMHVIKFYENAQLSHP